MIPYEKSLYQIFLSLGHADKRIWKKVLQICNKGTNWVTLLKCYC